MELLERYHVGGRIPDFVREHHGTSTVVTFLQKAAVAGSEPDIEDYRYPGPRPRSRETAVLMMADRIEAMARARGAASDAEFRAIVSRALDELLADGQLDESTLTLRDLARLQPAFVTALANLYHTRVTYPDVPRPADVLPIPGGQNRDVVRLRRAGGERPHRVQSAADDVRRRH